LAHDLSERFGLLPLLRNHSNTYLCVTCIAPLRRLPCHPRSL
jgi:hypothetical protein